MTVTVTILSRCLITWSRLSPFEGPGNDLANVAKHPRTTLTTTVNPIVIRSISNFQNMFRSEFYLTINSECWGKKPIPSIGSLGGFLHWVQKGQCRWSLLTSPSPIPNNGRRPCPWLCLLRGRLPTLNQTHWQRKQNWFFPHRCQQYLHYWMQSISRHHPRNKPRRCHVFSNPF